MKSTKLFLITLILSFSVFAEVPKQVEKKKETKQSGFEQTRPSPMQGGHKHSVSKS
jgi:hypothetical protein